MNIKNSKQVMVFTLSQSGSLPTDAPVIDVLENNIDAAETISATYEDVGQYALRSLLGKFKPGEFTLECLQQPDQYHLSHMRGNDSACDIYTKDFAGAGTDGVMQKVPFRLTYYPPIPTP